MSLLKSITSAVSKVSDSAKSSSSKRSSSKTSSSKSSSSGITQSDTDKINSAKQKYAEAQAKGDTAGMESAHKEAEAIRANYGYSGGTDGSQKISLSNGSWVGNGTSPTTGETTYGTSTDYGTYQDDLERLSRAQQKTQIAQLKQARDKALANLDVQEQEIKPTYQTARNQTSATSQSGARSFAEYLANRGLTNSGASAQGEINRLSALQNSLGNIDTAEANAYRDIANQRTAVENDYVAGVANANNAIAQEYYNNLLNYNQQQREMVNQLQQQALGQYANDYQAQINNLLAQGYSPNSLEVLQLQALRGNKMGTNYSNANTPENALASIQAGNINYNNASALGWTVAQAQQYYNDLLARAQAEAQAEADQQAFENSIKLQELENDKKNTNSLIEYRKNGGNSGNDDVGYTLSLSQAIKELEAYEGKEEEMKNRILNLETSGLITEKQANQLFNLYSLK